MTAAPSVQVRTIALILAAVIVVATGPRAVRAQSDTTAAAPVFAANAVQWQRLPNDVQRRHLVGRRPTAPTEFVAYRERYPATFMCDSARIAVHRHIGTQHIQVLRGTLRLGMGPTVDFSKAQAYGPGSFIALPSGTPHYEWSRGELEIHVDAVGEPRIARTRLADGSVDRVSPSTFVAAPCANRLPDETPAPPNGVGEWKGNRIMLTGDNPSMGLVAFRIRYPEAVPPVYHYHYGTEHVTIYRGMLLATFGSTGMDSAKAIAYGPGSFIEIPAGMPHADWIAPGLEAHVEFVGPTSATSLDPKTNEPIADPAPPPGTTRPTPPTRDPFAPGFVPKKVLPDGAVPSPDENGNFVIGPTHPAAPEMTPRDGRPRGTVHTFTMRSEESRIYPGIARDSGTFGTVSPNDPATLVVTTSRPAPYTRTVAVYVPAQYVPGTEAPFIVGADGPDAMLFTALDNLIAEGRVPPLIAISIGNGGGDAQGSQRGLEYDTMSGRYAEFVETEVLPLVEQKYGVRLTKDPEGRATMGGSSGGSAAFIMAWYRPDLYRRVLAYSITAINQQWPHSDETPHGAWELHERLIPNSPAKPIRVWLMVGDRDFLNPNVMRDGMHDWVLASEHMARVLAARGYRYQYVFARNAAHVDRDVKRQTLPEALEWLWRDYTPTARR